MKLKFLFFALVALALSCNGKKFSEPPTDLTLLKLKGDVKSIKELSYVAIEKFGEIEKGMRKSDDLGEETDYYIEFNRKGRFSNRIDYNFDNSARYRFKYFYDTRSNDLEVHYFLGQREEPGGKEVFKYDAENKLIQLKDYEDQRMYRSVDYIYDENKNLIEELNNGEISHEYEYDKNGNLIADSFFSSGYLHSKNIFKYDNLNRKTVKEFYTSDGRLSSRDEFKYGHNGSLREMKRTYDDVEIVFTYLYDEQGNLTEERYVKREGNKREDKKINYKYEYDKKGNWITCIKSKDNNPQFVREREIEYYDPIENLN